MVVYVVGIVVMLLKKFVTSVHLHRLLLPTKPLSYWCVVSPLIKIPVHSS